MSDVALADPGPRDGLAGAARTRAVFAVSLSVVLSALDYSVVNIALPSIARNIHASASAAIWVANAYQLASLIALLPLAAAGDRLGHARVCRVGLVLFVIASLLCAGAHNLAELASARALQGLGAACIMSVNAALVRFIYPNRLFGRGIAFNGLILALGIALGPSVGAAVLAVADWRWLFLINLPLGGAALYFALTALPEIPLTRSLGRFDWASTGLIALSFGAIIIGGDGFAHHDGAAFSTGLILGGLFSLAVLVQRQLRRADPLLPVDLLTRTGFREAFAAGFLSFVASNFFLISMPFNFVNVLHMSPSAAGLLMTPWAAAVAAIAPFAGRLSDRFHAKLLSTFGLCILGCGFIGLRLLANDPAPILIAGCIGLCGTGFGICQPPNNKAMILSAPASRTGSASGMVSVARLGGQTIGGMLVALTLGLVAHDGTATCLSLAAASAFIAAAVSASRRRTAAY